jgi:3,4-dihydroxy 2-butanone 4-phosphate synthase/GTP cyclohydrolase II
MTTTAPPAPTTGAAVRFEVETRMPTRLGTMRVRAYAEPDRGVEHLAVVVDPLGTAPLVRVHSECLTGEVLGSSKCECGPQLEAALAAIAEEGGIVVYMRGHEGRGIGLVNKLRAYRLQEDGLDTVEANTALGLPVDGRDFTAAAAILRDLGADRIRLLTNNPDKIGQLEANGVRIAERVPLVLPNGPASERYLETKRARLGHLIPVPAAG